jgi:hypothetical protein
LLLYLGLSTDEFGEGIIVRCKIDGWRCNQVVNRVDGASSGGNGIFGTVRGLGKLPAATEGGSFPLPPQYEVKIEDPASRLLVRQVFTSIARPSIRVTVAPSGAQAILGWAGSLNAQCPQDKGMAICETGIIVDLSGRLK